jgi:hypothetical protein
MQLFGKEGGAGAVLGVVVVVVPTGVMQEGEVDHHIPPQRGRGGAEMQAVLKHPGPVGGTMKAIPLQPILAADEREQGGRKTRFRHGRAMRVMQLE